MERLNDEKAVKIADDIYWIGFADFESEFSNNPYPPIDGDECAEIFISKILAGTARGELCASLT
jgi:hypothetical protein